MGALVYIYNLKFCMGAVIIRTPSYKMEQLVALPSRITRRSIGCHNSRKLKQRLKFFRDRDIENYIQLCHKHRNASKRQLDGAFLEKSFLHHEESHIMNAIKLGRSMGLLVAVSLSSIAACSSDNSSGDGDGDTATTNPGDGDGDGGNKGGDGDGDTNKPGDGDGDGDTNKPGDGDGDGGSKGGDGDGDTNSPGDGDGDGDTNNPGDGDGDIDPPEGGSGIEADAMRVLDNAVNPYGATFSEDGYLYVSGTTDVGLVTDAQSGANLRLAVWRFTEDNVLDTSFGTGGVAVSNIANPGTSYDIVELADGSLVVHMSGGAFGVALSKLDVSDPGAPIFSAPSTVEFGWTAAQLADVGTLCSAAATAATAVTDALAVDGVCEDEGLSYDVVACGALEETATTSAAACTAAWPAATAPAFAQRPSLGSSWGMGLDSSGATEKIVVFGEAPAFKVTAGTQRTDTDRFITRLIASDFSFDATFNGGAPVSVDLNGAAVNNGARRGTVAEDGSILSAGYTSWGAGGNHLHVIRLLPNGTLDADFGFSDDEAFPWQPGYTHFNPFRGVSGFAEAYNAIPVGDGKYVSTGYGVSHFEASTIENDLVTFRFTAEGLDDTWGGNAAGDAKFGSFAIQSETDLGAGIGTRPYRENGRDLAALPDGRILQVGCYDDFAAIFVVTVDGQLDEEVGGGTGRIQYTHPFPFFKVAVSKDGTRVAATAQSRAKVNTGTAPVYARSFLTTLVIDVE